MPPDSGTGVDLESGAGPDAALTGISRPGVVRSDSRWISRVLALSAHGDWPPLHAE